MLSQIFANNSENIISMGKTSCSLQKDEVMDCVQFSSVCKKTPDSYEQLFGLDQEL
jgi:hypothetical protein